MFTLKHNLDIDNTKLLGIKSYYYDADKKDLNKLKEFLNKNISKII
mgnify:CR=1 FL=1